MFGNARRSAATQAGVLFCDPRAGVSAAAQRVQRRYARTRACVHILINPR